MATIPGKPGGGQASAAPAGSDRERLRSLLRQMFGARPVSAPARDVVTRLLETERVREGFPGLAASELRAAAWAIMDELDTQARSVPRRKPKARRAG